MGVLTKPVAAVSRLNVATASATEVLRPNLSAIMPKRAEPKAMQTLISNFITTFWTPIFVTIFLAILVYALRPSNREAFDDAAKMPLRED